MKLSVFPPEFVGLHVSKYILNVYKIERAATAITLLQLKLCQKQQKRWNNAVQLHHGLISILFNCPYYLCFISLDILY